MGDLIILTLALRQNGQRLDDYDWLIEKRSEVWAKYLGLTYYCYDRFPLKTAFSLIARYKNVYNSEQYFSLSQVYSKLCTSNYGILTAFDTNRLNLISNKTIPYDPINSHEVIEFSKLFGFKKEITQFISQNISDSDSSYSLLWLAGTQSSSRRFDTQAYINLLKQGHSSKVYIVGGPQERALAESLYSQLLGNNKEIQIFQGTFIEACYLLKNASELLTVDSSPVHLGSYFGVKTHALFTSGIIKKWHPLSKGSIIYKSNELSCSPCTLFGQVPPCLNQYQCKSINFSHPIPVEEFVNNYH